ncbi:MAG: hypothetical protein LBV12_08305, partial [Puniceicoccales bacterium]|nr:hypothetical protein [Puniceicoccales bacterium]
MSQSPKKKRPKRGILHHLYGLLTFALVLLLPCQLLLWRLVHDNAQFTLPYEATEKVRATLNKAGLKARFGEVKVSLTGRVEIKDLEIGQPGRKETLLTVQKIVADFNLFDLVQGIIDPRRISVDGGTLYCPQTGSPEGRTTVFKDIRARISQEGRWVNIETAQARFGEMPLVGYDILIPKSFLSSTTPSGKKDIEEKGPTQITADDWRRGIQVAEVMLQLKAEMEKLGHPSLEVTTLSGLVSNNVVFSFLAQGNKFTLPGNASANDAELSFTIHFDGEKLSPGRDSLLSVSSASWVDENGLVSVQTGALVFASRLTPDWGKPITGYFSAHNVVINGEQVDFAQGVVDWSQFPKLNAKGLVVDGTDYIRFSGEGDWETREAKAELFAHLQPNRYMENPKVKPLLPDEIATLRFYEVPELQGTVQFAPGFKFTQAELKAALGSASFEEFRIIEGNARIRLTMDRFDLLHADLRARNYRAEGRFYTGFTNESEYRVSIRGNTQPEFLNKFLPDWWSEIWDAIKLNPENLPLADLDIHGQWEGRPDEAVYCAVAGRDAVIRGQQVDLAQLRIVETPNMISLFDILAVQRGLSAGGNVQFQYNVPPEEYKLHSIRFSLHGTLPKETAVELVADGLPEILAPLKVELPVTAAVSGWFHYDGSPTPKRRQVFVTAEGTGPMSAWDIPFTNFQGTVAYDDDQAVITINRGSYAGGKIIPISVEQSKSISDAENAKHTFHNKPSRAWLDLRQENPQLQIDAEILNAGRVAFFEGLSRLKDDYKPAAPAPNAVPDESKMNIRFNGTVTLPLVETLSGTGHVYYYDPQIPSLHIFGGLSKILDRLGL